MLLYLFNEVSDKFYLIMVKGSNIKLQTHCCLNFRRSLLNHVYHVAINMPREHVLAIILKKKRCIYLYTRGRWIILDTSEAAEKMLTFIRDIPRCKTYIKLSKLPFKIKKRIFLKVTNK